MRTGIILLAPSLSKETDLLVTILRENGAPVLDFSQHDVHNALETVTNLITDNPLESVVASNVSSGSMPDLLRYSTEAAGLGSHAVGWIDLVPLLGGALI